MLRIGPAARIMGHRPELVLGLLVLATHAIARGLTVTLSHGLDGKHMASSLHYNGLGDDFVIQGFTDMADKMQFSESMRIALGQDFDFIYEGIGTPNEHWHIEFQPKAPY